MVPLGFSDPATNSATDRLQNGPFRTTVGLIKNKKRGQGNVQGGGQGDAKWNVASRRSHIRPGNKNAESVNFSALAQLDGGTCSEGFELQD